MADTTGQALIRGLHVDKVVRGFADENLVIRKHINVQKTPHREVRYYTKTSGFLDTPDTTAITASQIANTSERAKFPVVGQSWTRNTAYMRKYAVESETISIEDLHDNDVDVMMTTLRDLTLAVLNQVDTRIFNVLSESLSPSNINTAAAVGTGWDDATSGNPIKDLLVAKQKIRSNGYDPNGGVVYINSIEEKNLINYLISNGANFPEVSVEELRKGVIGRILNLNVVVSENATTDYALVFTKRAATWKSFVPLSTAMIDDPGIGKKVRIWEEGECILHDPKAVHLITDTVT